MGESTKTKYQIFISSTYGDLKEERKRVIMSILDTENIPVGMENFSATDDRGWGIIKRTIDSSDIYVLIIAGRYGYINSDMPVCWTEKEYDYARGLKIPILVFIRDKKSIKFSDADTGEKAEKLNNFIERLQGNTGHLVKYWKKCDDLQTKVILAIKNQIERFSEKENNLHGWQRTLFLTRNKTKETVLRCCHTELTVIEMRERNLEGHYKLIYKGSTLVESPDSPINFADTYASATSIDSFSFSREAIVQNKDQFERNPRILKILIKSEPDEDCLYFNGKVVISTQFSPDKGGFGLHIPYLAEYVTFVVDMSRLSLKLTTAPIASLSIPDTDNVYTRSYDLINTNQYGNDSIWYLSAKNIPANSNIEFSWGDHSQGSKT
jgi:hypothetical protein